MREREGMGDRAINQVVTAQRRFTALEGCCLSALALLMPDKVLEEPPLSSLTPNPFPKKRDRSQPEGRLL